MEIHIYSITQLLQQPSLLGHDETNVTIYSRVAGRVETRETRTVCWLTVVMTILEAILYVYGLIAKSAQIGNFQ